MISFFKKIWQSKRGNALVIAGASLPMVMGAAGLASDTIQWALRKRQLQRAADSASMAGVYAESAGAAVGTCSDVAGATYTNPVAYDVKKNEHLPQVPNCTVSNPPSTGSYTKDSKAVHVTLTMQRPLSFSGMFLSAAPTITANATATVVPSGQYCVVSLESQAVTGIDATGSTNVDLGCGMITNSTSLTAAVATGSSSVTASPIAAVGGIPSSTHWGDGTVLQPFTVAQVDPFANVSPTPVSNGTPSCWSDPNVGPQATTTLQPGCYSSFTVKGTANLQPGTYYINGGSIDFNSGAVINCSGCTFVLSNSDPSSTATIGGITMNGTATLNLSAPSSGTYKGLIFDQDRRATSGNTIKINGDSNSFLQGAMYFPTSNFTYNGNSGQITNCLQIVAKDVTFTGNSAVNNSCPANSGSSAFTGQQVRLVE